MDQTEALTDVLFSDEHIFSLRNKELKVIAKIHRDEKKDGATVSNLCLLEVIITGTGNNDDVGIQNGLIWVIL
ncbi:MAG: hypothetical protein ACLU4J_03645 [Butyricimonas paravirosa]